MFYRGNNIVHARRRDHLMWRRYWSQVILDHMAQKGTKRQFDISELSRGIGISVVDIVATFFT
ncbi:hypothetical protein T4B_1470 [Trichinella pseudospiralis]|uniref:Histone acetyltransferase n=2 Tax=Trichinella pseudospiralis TaxID=6337 RepID=A0A0V1GFP0_TRIPS|nr:hypothetical protein T4A_1249 [Trichinella pseudospiralis]KRY97087.1 hypothetical protein T4B_1470 [Trichinella pseudospiralis]KRY99156.1 hypothetical protein T4C_3191 [Trichinella pseudospiralis]